MQSERRGGSVESLGSRVIAAESGANPGHPRIALSWERERTHFGIVGKSVQDVGAGEMQSLSEVAGMGSSIVI